MTEKQRFLVYVKIGYLIAQIRKKNGISISAAIKILLKRKIIQKIEDLETGYYLEGGAYLAEVFQIEHAMV